MILLHQFIEQGDRVPSNLSVDGHSFRRVEVLTGTPRRRRRRDADKAAIVAESPALGAKTSEIALLWASSQSALRLAAPVSLSRGCRQFGRRSEKLDPDQFNLVLEDLEQAVAASEAEQEKADPAMRQARSEKRRTGRGSLPEHLPREIVVEPEDTACPCCGSAMHVIGEDRSQRLDVSRRNTKWW